MTEASITARIAALQEMSLGELRGEFEKVFGKPSLSRNRKVLVKRIAEKLQSGNGQENSGAASTPKPTLVVQFERKSNAKRSGKTKKVGKEKGAKPRPAGQRDRRLPRAGTDLVREWHGKKYVVRVLESGFEYNSKPFRSLSGVAKAISGQIVNGFAWFGLIPQKGKKS